MEIAGSGVNVVGLLVSLARPAASESSRVGLVSKEVKPAPAGLVARQGLVWTRTQQRTLGEDGYTVIGTSWGTLDLKLCLWSLTCGVPRGPYFAPPVQQIVLQPPSFSDCSKL